MKKTIVALMLSATLIPAAVFAGSHYGDKIEHRVERMTEQLQLNEQQRVEVQKIFEEQYEKKRAMREQMRAETQARIGKVLTPEQQAQWQQQREARKQRACDHHGKDGKGNYREDHERGEGTRKGADNS